MLIGYLRGKADDTNTLVAHRQALHGAGCERVVEDLATAGGWAQPELRALLDGLREGDVVVVPQLDCLGAALADVVRRIGRITAASASLRSLKEGIDTATDTPGARRRGWSPACPRSTGTLCASGSAPGLRRHARKGAGAGGGRSLPGSNGC